MKHYWTLSALTLLSLSFACKNKDCPNKVDLVQPGENPPNYEVIIHPEGFSQQATVRFGQEVAVTRPGDSTDIIAKVPAGLRGSVEISLEENDCVGRRNFTVLDSLPGTYGASLQNIVLPSVSSSVPLDVTNEWKNAADPNHVFFLSSFDHPFELLPGSQESDIDQFGNVINPVLNGNPISGTWSKTPNAIHLVVDRTQHGGTKEEFNGQFILSYPGAPAGATNFIALISKTTGRQLILYN